MYTQRSLCTLFLLVLAALGSFGAGNTQADPITLTYQITVDTSSIINQYGYLDFQFNPGALGAEAATATVTNFSTDGTLNPNDPANNDPLNTYGDWSGSLTNTLTLKNDMFTEVFEGFTFGSTIGFDVTLSGPALNSPGLSNVGSSFAFSLYANDTVTPLLVDNNQNDAAFSPNGAVAAINLNPDGSATPQTFPNPNNPNFDPNNPNSPSGGTVTPQSSTPEPSTCLLLSIGAAGVWMMRKRIGIMPVS